MEVKQDGMRKKKMRRRKMKIKKLQLRPMRKVRREQERLVRIEDEINPGIR